MSLPGWPQPVDIRRHAHRRSSPLRPSPTSTARTTRRRSSSARGSTYVSKQQGGVVAFNSGSVRFTFQTQDIFNEWNGARPQTATARASFRRPQSATSRERPTRHRLRLLGPRHLRAQRHREASSPDSRSTTRHDLVVTRALPGPRGPAREDIFIGGDANGSRPVPRWIRSATYRYRHASQDRLAALREPDDLVEPSGRRDQRLGTGPSSSSARATAIQRLTSRRHNRISRLLRRRRRDREGLAGQYRGPRLRLTRRSGSSTVRARGGRRDLLGVRRSHNGATVPGTLDGDAWTSAGTLLWSDSCSGPSDFSSPVIVPLTGGSRNDVLIGSGAGLYRDQRRDGGIPVRNFVRRRADRPGLPRLQRRRGGRRPGRGRR